MLSPEKKNPNLNAFLASECLAYFYFLHRVENGLENYARKTEKKVKTTDWHVDFGGERHLLPA